MNFYANFFRALFECVRAMIASRDFPARCAHFFSPSRHVFSAAARADLRSPAHQTRILCASKKARRAHRIRRTKSHEANTGGQMIFGRRDFRQKKAPAKPPPKRAPAPTHSGRARARTHTRGAASAENFSRARDEKTRCHFETLARTIRRTFAHAMRARCEKWRSGAGFFQHARDFATRRRTSMHAARRAAAPAAPRGPIRQRWRAERS